MIEFAVFGFVGGCARALVGISKSYKHSRVFIFDHKRFWFTLITSAVLGAVAALLVAADYRMAILAGYAGTDVLEGLIKVKFKRW